MFKVIFAAISAALAPFIARILSAVGIAGVGFLVFEATVRPILTKFQQMALTQIGAIPPEFAQFVYLTGINDAISIIFGAFFTALLLKGAKAIQLRKASKYTQPWNGF